MQIKPGPPSNHSEEEYDIEKLIDKITLMKNRLLEVSRRSNATVNLSGKVDLTRFMSWRLIHSFPSLSLVAVFELDNASSAAESHEACQLELQQLRQELEWYKREEIHGNRKTSNVPSNTQDDVLNQMRVQIQFLRSEMEHSEQEHKDSLRSIQESWAKERNSWKDEMVQTERSCRARVADMEQQLQKQRERSLTLLEEKDEELASLRELLNMKSSAPLSPTSVSQPKVTDSNDEWPESLAPLASMTLGASASGGQILHYVEELARKEGEIQGLRRSKNQLEASLREIQMAFVTTEHKVAEQKQHLHEELARLERNQSREGANLEYLKNVLLEFFLRSDPSSQSHMFNAIAACLHFSPQEIQRVRLQHPKWKLTNSPVNPSHSDSFLNWMKPCSLIDSFGPFQVPLHSKLIFIYKLPINCKSGVVFLSLVNNLKEKCLNTSHYHQVARISKLNLNFARHLLRIVEAWRLISATCQPGLNRMTHFVAFCYFSVARIIQKWANLMVTSLRSWIIPRGEHWTE